MKASTQSNKLTHKLTSRFKTFSMAAGACLILATSQLAVATDPDPQAIVLGNSSAQTGPLATLSGEYIEGAQLFFNRLNSSGGIHGRQIELRIIDDGYDNDRAEQNARQLIEQDKVFALFGFFGTGPSLKAMPVAIQAGVPFFAPYSGADALRQNPNPNVFHLRASYSREIERIVSHLTTLGVTSIGVIHHADAFGQAGLQAAQEALAKRGLEPAITAAIDVASDNADEALRAIASANPAALILVAAGRTPPMIIRGLREANVGAMLYGLSVVSSNELVRTLGQDAHGLALAQVTPSPFRVDFPLVREYRATAEAAGVDPSYAGLEGYIAATVFTEALRRAGPELSRAGLRSALDQLSGERIGGLRLVGNSRNPVGLDFIDLIAINYGRFAN